MLPDVAMRALELAGFLLPHAQILAFLRVEFPGVAVAFTDQDREDLQSRFHYGCGRLNVVMYQAALGQIRITSGQTAMLGWLSRNHLGHSSGGVTDEMLRYQADAKATVEQLSPEWRAKLAELMALAEK